MASAAVVTLPAGESVVLISINSLKMSRAICWLGVSVLCWAWAATDCDWIKHTATIANNSRVSVLFIIRNVIINNLMNTVWGANQQLYGRSQSKLCRQHHTFSIDRERALG